MFEKQILWKILPNSDEKQMKCVFFPTKILVFYKPRTYHKSRKGGPVKKKHNQTRRFLLGSCQKVAGVHNF